MALVQSIADYRIAAVARSILAGVSLGAGIAVVAVLSISLWWVAACARGRITGACYMALVQSIADYRIAAGARSILAGVSLGAGIAIVAGRSISLWWVAACARGRITGARYMALVQSSADYRIAAGANPGLAGVGLSAEVIVVAGYAIFDGCWTASNSLPPSDTFAYTGIARPKIATASFTRSGINFAHPIFALRGVTLIRACVGTGCIIGLFGIGTSSISLTNSS